RGVPGARSAATRHSEQGRPLGDGPIDALVPSAACPEAVAPGVRPAERAAELDQAAACVAPLHEVGEAAPTLSGLVGCQERLAAAAVAQALGHQHALAGTHGRKHVIAAVHRGISGEDTTLPPADGELTSVHLVQAEHAIGDFVILLDDTITNDGLHQELDRRLSRVTHAE